jgi:hypothetical protein
MEAHDVLPGVHRVAALVKRWLLGTHQGSFSTDHLQAYLDEFVFRFNRRESRARGMLFYRLLEQSVAMHPISFEDLVANPKWGIQINAAVLMCRDDESRPSEPTKGWQALSQELR